MSKAGKTLYAGAFLGEFGWELFCWQGFIRKKAREYAQCVVACREGHEVLYKDFAQVIPVKIDCRQVDMWSCNEYKDRPFEHFFDKKQLRNDWIKPNQPVCRYDHENRQRGPLFQKFKEQLFVPYGRKDESLGYDILIHARWKNNFVNAGTNSKVRNWPESHWERFAERFPDRSIACIGTLKDSLHVAGEDLRGIPLSELVDEMASSRVLVSPSSGPVHLAALCKCPHVTWYGAPYNQLNDNRFLRDWNPFRTPVEVCRFERWDAPLKEVVERTQQVLSYE